MSSQTSWFPSRLWLKCNRLLKLGRPVGAVTLSRWEWWWNERWIWGARGGGALNLISTNYPDHGHHGRLPLSRKNAHGRAGNRTRDVWLVVRSSDHQATRLVTDDNIIRRMRTSRRISNVTNTHSEYVIIITFPLQQWLHERASLLSWYLHDCLVIQHNPVPGNNKKYIHSFVKT